ncbi:heparin lyase I family protein [Bradyrhizobium sp. DASA03120]|uniref:heparin lyase I family protein n=1 Tax=Bradyrhizobium sp. SMVTL-02 TaxID=3395917 RepID=UPI003F724AC4
MLQSFGPLAFGFLVLHHGMSYPLAPVATTAANGAVNMVNETSDHSAEIVRPFPANGSTTSIDNNVYTTQSADRSWSVNSLDADTLRFEVRSGDRWVSSDWADPVGVERSEIAGQKLYPPGAQIGIAYDFMVEPGPRNSASGPGRFLVFGQMHEFNVNKSPPFAVELVNGDHMAIDIGTGIPVYLYVDPDPIQRGRYYSMQVRVKFDSTRDGVLQVWRDGVQIVHYHGPIGTGAQTYWKQGIYRSSARETIAVCFRGLKITAAPMSVPR